MRSDPIPPSELSAEQKTLHDDIRATVEPIFRNAVWKDEAGALLGPFIPWVRHPQFGVAAWDVTKALSLTPAVPPVVPGTVREIAILAVGAHFCAAYELYVHVLVAGEKGLPEAKIASIAAGVRPVDLSEPEAVTYDLTTALLRGGALPEVVYRRTEALFGAAGAAELIHLVGLYCFICIVLNGFDIGVPRAP